MKRAPFGTLGQGLLLLILVVGGGVVAWRRNAIIDWALLRAYTPPAAIAQLADETTMTALGKHWFYLDRPELDGKTAFNEHCGSLQSSGEGSAVLGCFTGNRRGIYLYNVTDPRLSGVIEVTAAHEMLHQAYTRLSSQDRTKVDAMLLNFSKQLTDQTVKDQLAAYHKSEPGELVNEMNSLFGTEIANLPAPLEKYYARYFVDRAKVVAFNAQYQAVFTAQIKQIDDYDAQLATLKKTIDAEQADLQSSLQTLQLQKAQLDAMDQGSAAYRAAVVAYNARVNAYNSELIAAKQHIEEYNQIVDTRNAIAVQERELESSLNSQLTPIGQ